MQAIQPRVVDTNQKAEKGIEALQRQLTTNPSFVPRIVTCPPYMQNTLSYSVGSPDNSQYSYGIPMLSPIQQMYPIHQTVLLNPYLPPMQTSFLKQFPTIEEEIEPESRKFSSLNTRNTRKAPQFQSMRVVRKRNIERFYPNTDYGENFTEINNNKNNQDNSLTEKERQTEDAIYANCSSFIRGSFNISGVDQLFENLTDSIQVCEDIDDPINESTESVNKPVPAPRTKMSPFSSPEKTDHVYVNLSMPLINTSKLSFDTVDSPTSKSRLAEYVSKPALSLPRKLFQDDADSTLKRTTMSGLAPEKDEASILDEDDDKDEKFGGTDATKPNIIGATPKKSDSVMLPSTSLVKSAVLKLNAESKDMNKLGLPKKQVISPNKTLQIPKLSEKPIPKKPLVRRSNSVQSHLTVSLDRREHQVYETCFLF